MSAFIILMDDGDVVLRGITQENYKQFAARLLKAGSKLYDAEFEAENEEVSQSKFADEKVDKGDPGFP